MDDDDDLDCLDFLWIWGVVFAGVVMWVLVIAAAVSWLLGLLGLLK